MAPDGRLGLAVSGGPDSLALLMLAHRAFPGRIAAATVDHRLRRESADEASMVAQLCAQRGIPHRTLVVTVPEAGNLQAKARAERYRALGSWAGEQGVAAVATAHHAEDQAETLLMRLNRGAGLKGLAAMRASRPMPMAANVLLIRPLLEWSRADLAAICRAEGLEPASDPSNTDPKYDRARIRTAMAGADWLDPMRLAASARHLRDAQDLFDAVIAEEFAACVEMHADGTGATYRPAPRSQGAKAVRFAVLERIFAAVGSTASPPRGAEIKRLIATLESGAAATLGGLHGVAAGPQDAPEWRLTREGTRKSG